MLVLPCREKTNLCQAIVAPGRGPDAPIGTAASPRTASPSINIHGAPPPSLEYTVVPEIAWPDQQAGTAGEGVLLGRGVTTRIRRGASNTARWKAGATVAVFVSAAWPGGESSGGEAGAANHRG